MVFIFFFFLFGVAVFLGIVITISKFQLNRSTKILNELSDMSLKKVKIKFLQNSTGKFAAVAGLNINAEMYFNENLVLITPKTNGIFNGLNNFNLPIIFSKNENEIGNLTDYSRVIKPELFKLTDFKTIIIKYEKYSIGNIEYNITIRLADKNEWHKVECLKNVY